MLWASDTLPLEGNSGLSERGLDRPAVSVGTTA